MKKALSIMFALLLLFLLPACGGEEDDYDDTPSGGDGGNGDNGGWELQEDKPGKVLKTEGFAGIYTFAIGLDDILYVGGATQEESKKSDAFLVAFDAKGKELWRKQWDYQESADTVNYLVTDQYGNIYVAGDTTNGDVPFVIKFAPDGTKIWEQFPELETMNSLAVDKSNNIYIVGGVNKSSKIIKYSMEGKSLWINDVDEGTIVTLGVDSIGNVYAGGYTYTSLFAENNGKMDAFLMKIALDGTPLWGKQWGDEGDDRSTALVVDSNDNIYVVGNSNGDSDMFFKFSSIGEVVWQKTETYYSIAIDKNNHIYPYQRDGNIAKYDSDGKYLGSFLLDNIGVMQIVCDNKDNIYMLTNKDYKTNIIKIAISDFK